MLHRCGLLIMFSAVCFLPTQAVADISINPQPGFSIVEIGEEGEFFNSPVPDNVARASRGAVAFGDFEVVAPPLLIKNINDGQYGDVSAWQGGSASGAYVGVVFADPVSICSIAWGRQNITNTDPARWQDTYTLEISSDPNVASDPMNASWTTVGTVTYSPPQNGRKLWLRHEYHITENGTVIQASAFRIRVTGEFTRIDEIEVYDGIPVSTLFVDADVPGPGDGLTWSTAFNSLPDAFALADCSVDTIRVAQGTYMPDGARIGDSGYRSGSGDKTATFQLINGISLEGGYAGFGAPDPDLRDVVAFQTILSGDLSGDDVPVANPVDLLTEATRVENSDHVVTGSNTDATAVIDGFTIAFANAMNAPNTAGGGMLIELGSPTVRNCTFLENIAAGASGMWIVEGDPVVTDCAFTRNAATSSAGLGMTRSNNPSVTNCAFTDNASTFSNGGGMFIDQSSPTVTNCTFTGNSTDANGGGLYAVGSHPVITNCTFTQNLAGVGGGGLYITTQGQTDINSIVTHCRFIDNSAMTGGGIYAFTAEVTHNNLTVNDSSFSGNTSASGGGVAVRDTNLTAINCAFDGNHSSGNGGAINFMRVNPIQTVGMVSAAVTNCVFNMNTAAGNGGALNGVIGASNSAASIVSVEAEIAVTNSTFNGNSATGNGGAMGYAVGNVTTTGAIPTVSLAVTVSNGVLWGNVSADGKQISNSMVSPIPVIQYCDVDGSGGSGAGWDVALGADGGHNIDADPLFVGVDDLRLSVGSPCIDSAHTGFYGAGPSVDITNHDRIFDDPATPDTGGGAVSFLDMGAYEFSSNSGPGFAAADLDADGDVDADDYFIFNGDFNGAAGTSGRAFSITRAGIGTIRYVDADAIGLADGSSWANAFAHPQDALAVAGIDDVIRVANGTYMPDGGRIGIAGYVAGTGDRTATFQLIDGVRIEGGYAGVGAVNPDLRDVAANLTILSGDLSNDDIVVADPANLVTEPTRVENSHHVVTGSNTMATAVIDGFTIRAGNTTGASFIFGGGMTIEPGSPTVSNCHFLENFATFAGGGLWVNLGDPVVSNCTFTRNSSTGGAGMVIRNSSNTTLTNCTFIGNTSITASGFGGGLFNSASSPTVTGCTFVGNTAERGAGMSNELANPNVIDCMFNGNVAVSTGGGINNNISGDPIVTNCVFLENSAISGGAIYSTGGNGDFINLTVSDCSFTGNASTFSGSAVFGRNGQLSMSNSTFEANTAGGSGTLSYSQEFNVVVTNCVFNGNEGGATGGAMSFASGPNSTSTSEINNCTIFGNNALSGGALSYGINTGSTSTVTNSIIGNNTAEDGKQIDINGISLPPVIRFSNIAGSGGSGAGWDVTLGIDGGNNIDDDPLFAGIDDFRLTAGSPCIDRADLGAYGGGPSLDVSGNDRLRDDPATPNTGVGAATYLDMGAYEFLSGSPALAHADLDQDGDVDLKDYSIFVSCYSGAFVPTSCP